jgi:sugar phosphate isomerase/epimerase
MPVELALTPDRAWDLAVDEVLAVASDAGFEAVGTFAHLATADATAAYAASEVRCHEVLSLLIGDDAADVITQAETVAAAAAAVDAPWVLTFFRSPIVPEVRAVLPRAAALLAEAGSGMAVEFAPMSSVATIADALAVVELVAPGHAGVLLDTWHFFVGADSWSELEQLPIDRIAYVQFDDALPPDPEHLMRATMRHRKLPGEGAFELERFASSLLQRGWEGTVSVEVLSDELRQLPVPEFARRAYETTARYWV